MIPHVDGIRLVTNIPDLQMFADPHLMHRMFGNLVLNAVPARAGQRSDFIKRRHDMNGVVKFSARTRP